MLSIIHNGNPTKLSKLLINKYNLNFNLINKLLRNKDIRINGVKISSDVTINDNDSIVVYYNEKSLEFKEIYNDNNILIVYKPKGINSEGENSAESILLEKYPSIKLCHRIDTNTDGLLMFAFNDIAYNEIYKALKERKILKYYYALVFGFPSKNQDILKDYLYKDSETATVKISKSEINSNWQQIITEYSVIKRFEESSLLLITLHTGKTHQIRAHLAFYKNPVLGDGKYGNEEINKKFGFKKQQLTFFKLNFSFNEKSPLFYLNAKVIELEKTLISCIRGLEL